MMSRLEYLGVGSGRCALLVLIELGLLFNVDICVPSICHLGNLPSDVTS
jgi:hypothetical protein